MDGTGRVTAGVGTQDFGMGHTTVFSQLIADRFGLPLDKIQIVQGDTDLVKDGAGSHGSRSIRIGGGAIVQAADAVIRQALDRAEELLETDKADIAFEAPDFVVRGTDRRISLQDIAADAEKAGAPLLAAEMFVTEAPSFPSGCHACEVEIDPETGELTIVRFITIADPGTVINPLIVNGQLHGGVAQAIGEATLEEVVYQDGSGQLLSGSMMDYTMPRADDLPTFETVLKPMALDDNPLGAKGVGEAGTVGTQAAVINATLDALRPLGVKTVDMAGDCTVNLARD